MSHPVDIHVGKRLRSRRTLLGMSQEELGKSVGVTFQQIQKYERGLNRIGSSRLYEFACILGVSVTYFFEDLDAAVQTKAENLAFIRSRLGSSVEKRNCLVFLSKNDGSGLIPALLKSGTNSSEIRPFGTAKII